VLVQTVVVIVHVTVPLVGVVLEQLGRVRRDDRLEELARGNCIWLVGVHCWGHVLAVLRGDAVVQEYQAILSGTPSLSCTCVGEEGIGLDDVAWCVV